jgi:hypothetical protein
MGPMKILELPVYDPSWIDRFVLFLEHCDASLKAGNRLQSWADRFRWAALQDRRLQIDGPFSNAPLSSAAAFRPPLLHKSRNPTFRFS